VNILITSANSAAAYQLKNRLGEANILLGDYHDLPGFMLKSGNMISLPSPTSTSYLHDMLALCLDRDIHAIYALLEEEINLLHESEQLFKEYNIVIHKAS
jgi:hypothetical protein